MPAGALKHGEQKQKKCCRKLTHTGSSWGVATRYGIHWLVVTHDDALWHTLDHRTAWRRVMSHSGSSQRLTARYVAFWLIVTPDSALSRILAHRNAWQRVIMSHTSLNCVLQRMMALECTVSKGWQKYYKLILKNLQTSQLYDTAHLIMYVYFCQ